MTENAVKVFQDRRTSLLMEESMRRDRKEKEVVCALCLQTHSFCLGVLWSRRPLLNIEISGQRDIHDAIKIGSHRELQADISGLWNLGIVQALLDLGPKETNAC